jgi:hypothetical protein
MNTSAINPSATLVHPGRRTTGLILSGCAVMFLILQGGATWLSGILDPTWAALIVTALMLLTAAVCERLVFNLTLPQAFRALHAPDVRDDAALGEFTAEVKELFRRYRRDWEADP